MLKTLLTTLLCLIVTTLSTLSVANEITENVTGDTIVILDDQDKSTETWQNKAQDVLMNAMSLTGIKYKYGGKTPETGFDCSGFVRYVFNQAANISLPPTARAISQIGKTVKKDELQPGDLVFFKTLKSAFSHVGIYVGHNEFIHAPSTGKTVQIESMKNSYWSKRFSGAQRIDQ